MAWLAGTGLDADDALINLRNFKLKEFHEQAWVGPAQNNLGRARCSGDVQHISLDAITLAVGFSLNLLALWKDGLCAPKVNDDVALLETPDDTGDEFALAVLEFVEGHLALCVANFLDDDLLSGLGCDATEVFKANLDAE